MKGLDEFYKLSIDTNIFILGYHNEISYLDKKNKINTFTIFTGNYLLIPIIWYYIIVQIKDLDETYNLNYNIVPDNWYK